MRVGAEPGALGGGERGSGAGGGAARCPGRAPWARWEEPGLEVRVPGSGGVTARGSHVEGACRTLPKAGGDCRGWVRGEGPERG